MKEKREDAPRWAEKEGGDMRSPKRRIELDQKRLNKGAGGNGYHGRLCPKFKNAATITSKTH